MIKLRRAVVYYLRQSYYRRVPFETLLVLIANTGWLLCTPCKSQTQVKNGLRYKYDQYLRWILLLCYRGRGLGRLCRLVPRRPNLTQPLPQGRCFNLNLHVLVTLELAQNFCDKGF